MKTNKTKKSYQAPKLTVHGDVEKVTRATRNLRTSLDANYPTGTPFDLLTFS